MATPKVTSLALPVVEQPGGLIRRMNLVATESIDFDALFAELQPGLLRAANRWAPAEAVDDVVQDTWLGVLRGIDRFEGRSRLSTWVYRILWHQCCGQWRRIDKKPPIDANPPDLASDKLEADPGLMVELSDHLRQVHDAIDELPNRCRQVIVLRDILDLSAPETCKAMELSEANQRVLLHRARSRVRASLPSLLAS